MNGLDVVLSGDIVDALYAANTPSETNPISTKSDLDSAASIDAFSKSTGVYKGGLLSVGTPNTTFSITDGSGAVISNTGATNNYTPVSWSGLTNITATHIASGLVSYVAINSAGAVIQQLTPFTQAQGRSLILLGSLIHVNLTNLDAVNNFQDVVLSPASMVHDISHALAIFNIGGNIFSANGGNLFLNKTVGNVYAVGSNWQNDVLNPSDVTLALLTQLSFQYRFQNGSNGATGASVNPDIYDLNGVSTATPANKFTIQRIYSFVSNNVKIQLGQNIYNSLAEAKAALQIEVFITETSIKQNGLLRGFLILRQGTTSLLNTSNVFFYEAGKFGGTTGVGGQSVSTMQNTYDNSLDPEILTDTTRGAVSIKRGSALDTDNILEGLNGAGVVTFKVTGAGNVGVLDEAFATSWNGSVNVPTKNSVYDALIKRVEVIAKTVTDGATLTGVTTETKQTAFLIPANTFIVGDVVELQFLGRKVGVAGSGSVNIYTNTSDTLSGATMVARVLTTAIAQIFIKGRRDLVIKSATVTEHVPGATSLVNDYNTSTVAATNTNIDWTIAQYIIPSLQLGAAADAITLSYVNIIKK